MKLVVKQLNEG